MLRSPYLAGIALWVGFLSLAGTFLYFQQANIVAAASDDPAVRTRIFATIDLAVGIVTLAVQSLVTGRLISRFGVGPAAAFLPLVFAVGFAVLATNPALGIVIAFQAAQRAANFAISNPAREILFTVTSREEKYKAKYVIDGVVFRGIDAASGSLFAALRGAGRGARRDFLGHRPGRRRMARPRPGARQGAGAPRRGDFTNACTRAKGYALTPSKQ